VDSLNLKIVMPGKDEIGVVPPGREPPFNIEKN
jgi:hypothetical protein